jgi:hypothetical protein
MRTRRRVIRMGRMRDAREDEDTGDAEELPRRPSCGRSGQRVLAYCLLVRVFRRRQVADAAGGPKANSKQHAFSLKSIQKVHASSRRVYCVRCK